MAEIFSLGNLFTLFLLILLQVVLGFDNLLYISIESKKAPTAAQSKVRKTGILIAIALRIVLLFVLVSLIKYFQEPISFLSGSLGDYASFNFNGHSLIVLGGGAFIIYTAIKEIWHMIGIQNLDHDIEIQEHEPKKKSANAVVISIVIMNLIFSFDSILAAIGLTKEIEGYTASMIVMSIAIVTSGILMMVLADKVSDFINRNRMYEVLGLFVLFIVGIMLVTEGGHLAHLSFFGNEIHAMSNTTFYFVITVLVLVDIVQGRYQKKLMAEKKKHNL